MRFAGFDINIVVYDSMSDMHKISLRLLRLMKAVARRNKIGNDVKNIYINNNNLIINLFQNLTEKEKAMIISVSNNKLEKWYKEFNGTFPSNKDKIVVFVMTNGNVLFGAY